MPYRNEGMSEVRGANHVDQVVDQFAEELGHLLGHHHRSPLPELGEAVTWCGNRFDPRIFDFGRSNRDVAIASRASAASGADG